MASCEISADTSIPVNCSLNGTSGELNISVLDVDSFLTIYLGPKQLPYSVVIPITVVYVLIFLSGVVGNVSVCCVIIRNTFMHTATNYYLFSLAVSDLTILLLGLPNDLSLYWQQYPWMFGETICKLRALVAEMTSYASVLTIVSFSLERYLAICHPLHAYTMSGLGRVAFIIGFNWAIALISAIPFAIFTGIHYVEYPPGSGVLAAESAFCAMFDENKPKQWPLYEMATLIFFVIPMGILCFLYVRMGVQIRRSARKRSQFQADNRHSTSRKTALTMLVAVVIGFFICWAPFHAQRLLYVYAQDSPDFRAINEKMYYITGCFYYFSATINPILYNVMSARYRQAFRETLCWPSSFLCCQKPRRFPERSALSRSSCTGTTWIRTNGSRRTRSSSTTGSFLLSADSQSNSRHQTKDSTSTKDSLYCMETDLNDDHLLQVGTESRRASLVPVNAAEKNLSSTSRSTNDTLKPLYDRKGILVKKPLRWPQSEHVNSIPAGCTPFCVRSSQITRTLSEMDRNNQELPEQWTGLPMIEDGQQCVSTAVNEESKSSV